MHGFIGERHSRCLRPYLSRPRIRPFYVLRYTPFYCGFLTEQIIAETAANSRYYARQMQTIRTPEKRAKFLEALRSTCNVTRACELSDLGRASTYEWRAEDDEFRKDWDDAVQIAADLLEEEAVRRAYEGVTEPVYQGGKLVGHVQKYSDTLLIFLLKGSKPRKYSERMQAQITGVDDGPVQFVVKSILDQP
jgi:hypothetical protein